MFNNWDIKKTIIWLLVILVSSFGIAGLIAVSEGNDSMLGILNNSENINTTKIDTKKELGVDGVSGISIKTVNTDITVSPYDGNTIKVHFYGDSRKSTNLPELITDESNKNIGIEIKHTSSFTFSIGIKFDKSYLDIQVPKNYSGKLDIKSVSGKIVISDLTLKTLSMNSVSGSLQGSKINVSDELLLETTSGKISFGEVAGRIKAESVSGDIDIKQNSLNDDINLNTVSGSIILQIPSSSEFRYLFKSTSGKLTNGFKGSDKTRGTIEGTIGKGGYSINARTVSGDFDLRKN